MAITINPTDVRRHGRTIILGQGRTATEGRDGGLNGLVIRNAGKTIKTYRGSSLAFSGKLTNEDKQYLASLGSDKN